MFCSGVDRGPTGHSWIWNKTPRPVWGRSEEQLIATTSARFLSFQTWRGVLFQIKARSENFFTEYDQIPCRNRQTCSGPVMKHTAWPVPDYSPIRSRVVRSGSSPAVFYPHFWNSDVAPTRAMKIFLQGIYYFYYINFYYRCWVFSKMLRDEQER